MERNGFRWVIAFTVSTVFQNPAVKLWNSCKYITKYRTFFKRIFVLCVFLYLPSLGKFPSKRDWKIMALLHTLPGTTISSIVSVLHYTKNINKNSFLFFKHIFDYYRSFKGLSLTRFTHVQISWRRHNNLTVHIHHCIHQWKFSSVCYHKEESTYEVYKWIKKIILFR